MSSQESDILRLNSDVDPEVLAHFIATTITSNGEASIVIVDTTQDAETPQLTPEETSQT